MFLESNSVGPNKSVGGMATSSLRVPKLNVNFRVVNISSDKVVHNESFYKTYVDTVTVDYNWSSYAGSASFDASFYNTASSGYTLLWTGHTTITDI